MLLGTYNIACAEDSNVAIDDSKASESQNQEIKGNKDVFEKAVQCMDKKDYQSAIVYLTAYINSKPKRYEAYKLRGDSFYALRQYILAQKDYQTAIDLKTDDDKFITGTKVIGAMVLGVDKNEQLQNPELGNLYARLMYAQKALNNPAYETTYSRAFEYNSHIYLPKPKNIEIAQINCPQKYGKVLNPQGVDKYLYGAIEDIEKGLYNEAVYKIQYVTSNYPKYFLGHYLTGVALVGLEKEKEAVAAFQSALKYNPYDFESFASLGQIYYNSAEKTFSIDDAKKSIEYFKEALKYNPNCYLYYYYIGLNELQMGNVDFAISNFNKAVKFKANDYNSLYYKLIAQYIKGDYESVVTGCTKLLYKHVSNYNSVLYLRALAYHKLGNAENAIADLEKIQNNVNDIYNADVKVISDKEKTLDSYLYYLKAQILKEHGFGAKSDMMKAVQNPIIAKLSKIEEYTEAFNKGLNSEIIPIDLYNGYSAFYNSSLPKMLQSNLLVSVEDIDNQYDYIRTTFDNLGITFVYQNPYYKMTNIPDYVYKKYHSRLSEEDQKLLLSKMSDEVKDEIIPQEKPLLKETTDKSDILASSTQPSIAQLLASHSLGAAAFQSASNVTVEEFVKAVPETKINSSESKIASDTKTVDDVKKVLDEESQIDSGIQVQTENLQEAEKLVGKTGVDAEKNDNAEEMLDNNSIVTISSENKDNEKNIAKSQDSEPIKIVAKETKDSPDFEIAYSEKKDLSKDESVDNNSKDKSDSDENIQEKETSVSSEQNNLSDSVSDKEAGNQKDEKFVNNEEDSVNDVSVDTDTQKKESSDTVEVAKTETKIVEKHAQVNPADFDFVHKPLPEVDSDAEVVELEPHKFMGTSDKNIASQQYSLQSKEQRVSDNYGLKTDNFDAEPVEKQSAQISKDVNSEEADSAVVIPEAEVSDKDKNVAVPVVLVPKMNIPDSKAEKSEEKTFSAKSDEVSLTNSASDETENVRLENSETSALALRPQAELNEADLEKVSKDVQNINSEDVVAEQHDKAAKISNKISKEEKLQAKKNEKEAIRKAKALEKDRAKASKLARKEAKLLEKSKKLEAKKAAKQAKLEEKLSKAEAKKLRKAEAKKRKDTQSALSEQNVVVESSEHEVKPQQDDSKKISKQEAAIASFVQSTFGSSNDANDSDSVKILSDDTELNSSAHKIHKKKSKIRKSKSSKDKSNLQTENSNQESSAKKFSFKSWFAGLRKSDDAATDNVKTEKVKKQRFKKDKKSKEIDNAVQNADLASGNLHSEGENVVPASSKVDKEPKEKFSFKKWFSRFKKSDSKISDKETLKKEKKSKVNNKLRKDKNNDVELNTTTENNESIENSSVEVSKKDEKKSQRQKNKKEKVKKEKKKFHWWFNKKDNKTDESAAESKRFSKMSGDKSEVYVKTDKNKTIIKKLEK